MLLPRQPRIKSASGVYHCMLRGINKQDIFFDKQDYLKFLKVTEKAKESYKFLLYSYVLMPTHVHLEVKDEKQNLSQFMHSIEISYASYFNHKYNRIGHLFQDKFRSKPVEDEEYEKNLMRYIHQNPQEACISSHQKYRWSSYKEYLHTPKLVDIEHILKLFSYRKQEALEKFVLYNKEKIKFKNSSQLLEYEMKSSLTDNELIYFIKEILKIKNIQDIQKYNSELRDKLLKKLRTLNGLTYKQLSRVLGINIRVIQRVLNKK